MNKVLVLAAALTGSAALAADLNLTVESKGSSSIVVEPGATVNYSVIGELSDALNEGLSLWGADFAFSGGPLSQGVAPPGMKSFEGPPSNPDKDGINNPAGYGGTTVTGQEGELVQAGGGSNVIRNTADNAEFPVGEVFTGIAQPGVPEVLMTGTLTAPNDLGTYTLTASNVFATVIKAGEDGSVGFWATEAAGEGTIINLTIEVELSCAQSAILMSAEATPVCDATLPRLRNNVIRLPFDTAITVPLPGEVEIRELPAGADLSDDFLFSVEDGNILRIEENGTVLSNGSWYGIQSTPVWCGGGSFNMTYVVVIGDVNNTKFNDFADITDIFGSQGAADDDNRFDVNSSGFVDFADITDTFGLNGSFAPVKPDGHDCSP